MIELVLFMLNPVHLLVGFAVWSMAIEDDPLLKQVKTKKPGERWDV